MSLFILRGGSGLSRAGRPRPQQFCLSRNTFPLTSLEMSGGVAVARFSFPNIILNRLSLIECADTKKEGVGGKLLTSNSEKDV